MLSSSRDRGGPAPPDGAPPPGPPLPLADPSMPLPVVKLETLFFRRLLHCVMSCAFFLDGIL